MTTIIPLAEVDPTLVEDLLDAAFGKRRTERTAYKVREGAEMLEGLSVAAVDTAENELLGSLQCWPVALTDETGKMHPMIMVGPVAVYPDCQGEGIGQALMTGLLKELHKDESLPMVMIGDPAYYDRFFGFSPERTGGWKLPGPWDPERLLVRAPKDAPLPAQGKLGPWIRPASN
ncbi:GNAT family N-acetyltransferase [Sphingorhabdus sp. Alg231-15]|uniref:GNAT family N-acetyltransferase n=1 Tax=Sphingorhabdus sp. Alg231-15 TaxID=1922222 RepID=UPI000D5568FE